MTQPPTILPTLLPPADIHMLAHLAKHAPPGAFCELGVYRGGSAGILYMIAEQQGRTLHLYDTFSGHPDNHDEADDTTCHPPGRYNDGIDPKYLQELMPNAIIHIGEFPHTLVDMAPLAFVHSDMDLYHPTLAVCKLLPPMMVPGGQLYFDDYGHVGCEGVPKAVCEVFGDGPVLENRKRLVTV